MLNVIVETAAWAIVVLIVLSFIIRVCRVNINEPNLIAKLLGYILDTGVVVLLCGRCLKWW